MPDPKYKDPTENLNIEGSQNSAPQPAPKKEKIPFTTATYSVLAEGEADKCVDYIWMKGDENVAFALDEKGRVYNDPGSLTDALTKEGRIFLFRTDGSFPYAYEYKEGKLYVSDDPISTTNQLKEYPAREKLVPKASLDPQDIVDIPSLEKHAQQMKQYKVQILDVIDKKQEEVNTLKEQQKAKKAELEAIDKPDEVEPMEMPTFPFGSKVARFFKKLFTFFQGETTAYRYYKNQMELYNENQMEQASYRAEMEEYRNKTAPIKAQITELENKTKSAEDTIKALKANKAPSFETEVAASYAKNMKALTAYRNRMEVKLEAVADLIKNEAVNEKNLFANTWIHKNACEGKTLNDPGVQEHLYRYIVSRAAEDQINAETLRAGESAPAINQHILDTLNDGSAVDKIALDPDLRKLIQSQGDKPLNMDAFYKDYTNRKIMRKYEDNYPVNKLKNYRKSLIAEFGEKPLTADCLKDIARLKALDEQIAIAEKKPKDLHLYKNPKDRAKMMKRNTDYTGRVLGDLNRDPSTLDKNSEVKADLIKFNGPEYQAAIAGVAKNLAEASKKIEEEMKDIPDNVKNAWGPQGNYYSLDKMAELVENAVKTKAFAPKEEEIQGPKLQ